MEMQMSGMPSDNRDESTESGILTMAFVNMQPFDGVYSLSEGFDRGTIFLSLDKPFMPGGIRR